MAEHPTSVTRAIQLLLGLLVAGLAVTVLVVVFRNDLEDAWSAGHPADSAIEPLEFVPVTIVLYVVVALLVLTLIPLFRSGATSSYAARTTTDGGTTSGYSLTGSLKSAMPPAIRMNADSTEAKTGRSMKKLENFMTITYPCKRQGDRHRFR